MIYMTELQHFELLFQEACKEHSVDRLDSRLAMLMYEMEQVFQIPLTRDIEWELNHSDVLALYHRLSSSRSLAR